MKALEVMALVVGGVISVILGLVDILFVIIAIRQGSRRGKSLGYGKDA